MMLDLVRIASVTLLNTVLWGTGVAAGSVGSSRANCLYKRDRVAIKTCDAPRNVHVIRRGMRDVTEARHVSTRLHAGKNRRTILVGVQYFDGILSDATIAKGA
jgi:hypothetical protein